VGATLKDVAKLANVSIGTASEALNNSGRIAKETRQRVLKAASKLNYRRGKNASTLPQHDLGTIGLVTTRYPPKPIYNNFYEQVLHGAEAECQKQKINLMYAGIEANENQIAQSLPESMFDVNVDGLLLVGAVISDDISAKLRKIDTPVVLINAYTENASFDSILIENQGGAYNAVSYLIAQGHRHIGLIGSNPNDHPSIAERREGYLRALRAYDLSVDYIIDSTLYPDDAQRATVELLTHYPQVTAIFACNDDTAIGVIDGVEKCGRQVPSDISVIGFDNVNISTIVKPNLTTINVDARYLGELGVYRLIRRCQDKARSTVTSIVSTTLIERESVTKINT